MIEKMTGSLFAGCLAIERYLLTVESSVKQAVLIWRWLCYQKGTQNFFITVI